MKGHGKHRGYELHHPMSLGDFLAALFRRKPKKFSAAPEAFLRPVQPQMVARAESADDPLPREATKELTAAGDLLAK